MVIQASLVHPFKRFSTQSTIYRRHEKRMIKSYQLKDDPRSAPIRVLSGLPFFQHFIQPFQPKQYIVNDDPEQDSISETITTSVSTLFESDDNKFNNYPIAEKIAEKPQSNYFAEVFISGSFGGLLVGIFGRLNARILARPTCEVGFFGNNASSQFSSININAASSRPFSRCIQDSSTKIVSRALAAGMLFTTNSYFKSQFEVEDSKHSQLTTKNPFSISSVSAAAATGGVMATIFTPIELIKTRYSMHQSFHGKLTTSLSPQSILSEIKLIIEQQGFAALYKGGSIIYTGKMMGNIAYFGVYETMKSYLQSDSYGLHSNAFDPQQNKVSPSQILLAGSLAGVSYCTVMHPVNNIKANFQSQSANSRFYTIFHAMGEVGFMNMYRGYFLAALRAAPANATLFLGYEIARSMFP